MRGPSSLRARAAAAAPSGVARPLLLPMGGARHRRALPVVAAAKATRTTTLKGAVSSSSSTRARRSMPPASSRRSLRVSAVAMSPISDGVDDGRIPVTIITGFLGSGKTTLLNNVLRNKAGRRIAVIENEFGEIDIDSELVARTETLNTEDGDPSGAAAITVLSNGCLCCSVRGDLIAALNALWERRAEFDHIVIETTGLANPAPVIQSLYLDEDLPHRVRLDGVVTVVDAANAWRHLSGRQGAEQEQEGGTGIADFDAPINEAVEQVAYADRIVLNKVDLAGDGKAAAAAKEAGGLDALEARLRSVNELASVVRAVRGEVDVDYVLGVGGFDLGKVEEEVVRVANPAHGEPGHVCGAGGGDCGHDHDHEHGHSHAHAHDHDHEHGHSHAHAENRGSNPAHGEPGHVCGGGDCGHDHHHDHHAHSHHPHSHSHSHDHSTPSSASSTPPSLAFRGARSAARITAARHDDRVSSLSISVEGEMDLEKVNYTMGALLEARSEDLFRMKGILAIQGMEQRYVFQAVHALFEGQPDRAWREGEPRVSRMVLIGRELDADAFREAFERCLVAEGGDRPSEAVKARVAEEAAGKA